MKKEINRSKLMIAILLNPSAPFGDRHDAAMQLSSFDSEDVENALATIASDQSAIDDLADECAESLAEIWVRRGRVNNLHFSNLSPSALGIVVATIRAQAPKLFDTLPQSDKTKS